MVSVLLSRRALHDIAGVHEFSIEQWGELVADQYLDSIEDALDRLGDNPGLLKTDGAISRSLCFYRVRQHFLICAAYEDRICVIALMHGAMDLPTRIAELEPQLILEADMLYEQNKKS